MNSHFLYGTSSVASVIISVALMLFSDFLMTRITKLLRLPNVTAYIVAGILIGPYCLNLVPQRIIDGTDFLLDIALAFIAFSTGEFFKLSVLKKSGMKVVWITLFEAVLASVFVFILTFFLLRLELAFSIVLAALGARTLGGVMGSDLETIILASSVLYELLGPGCAKLALYLSKSYSTKLEDVAVVAETTETGEKKSDVELLIERIGKIRAELPARPHEEMSEEEAAFMEAAEEQRLAQSQAQRRRQYLRR